MTKYNKRHVQRLISAMNEFIKLLGAALEVNQGLIKPNQLTLQTELSNSYIMMKAEVTNYMTLDIGDRVEEEEEEAVTDDPDSETY